VGSVLRVRFLEPGISLWSISNTSGHSVPQLRMMIREVEEIIGREITIEEWNRL
jgi:hypothetical protein